MLKTAIVKTCSEFKSVLCLSSRNFHSNKIGILGLPFHAGQPKPGVCQGPDAIRNAGLIPKLETIGNVVKDFGNLNVPSSTEDIEDSHSIKRPHIVGNYCQRVSEAVAQIESEGYMCLALGGDHSLGIGTIYGHLQNNEDMCVVWVDAHADINTTSTSYTGNVHGMPVSFVLKGLHNYNVGHPAFDWIQPRLTPNDVVYIGLRDVDPMERFILNKWGIKAYDMRDIDRYGIMDVVALAMDSINPRRNRPVHVSFDIDALDSLVAPATGTPVPGGLTLREGLYIAEELGRTGNLCGLDLVEVNPDLGSAEDVKKTVLAAHQIIMGFLGGERGGNVPVGIKDLPLPEAIGEDMKLAEQSKN